MNSKLKNLLAHSPVIIDGGWGTQLQKNGLAPGACSDEWNLSHPEIVRSIAADYVRAGSKIILTNTFGANRILLAKYGLESKTAKIVSKGVELSLEGADSQAFVFTSIGPTGKLVSMGEISVPDIEDVFKEQIFAAVETGAEGIVIETMSDIEEAATAAHIAVQTGLPVVTTMVFNSGKNKDKTMMGVTIEDALLRLTDEGIDVFGANCGLGIEEYLPLYERIRSLTDLPLWIKPNAGMPTLVDGKATYTMQSDQFAGIARSFPLRGDVFFGGCCGTTPAFISALKQAFSKTQ